MQPSSSLEVDDLSSWGGQPTLTVTPPPIADDTITPADTPRPSFLPNASKPIVIGAATTSEPCPVSAAVSAGHQVEQPRPRAISSAMTGFLMKLSRSHLEWHIASSPALVYALSAVGGTSVKADKTLFTFEMPDEVCTQPRIVMVEREAALKTILLDSIVSVAYDKQDASRRSIKIVYWFDKYRRLLAPPTHPPPPNPILDPSVPTVVNMAASSSAARQFLLNVTFASALDARDAHILLVYMLSYGCPTLTSIFQMSASEPAEFVMLHHGYFEKRGKVSWSRRYARLYAGRRLVIYRTDKSALPVNVVSLARGYNDPCLVPRAIGKDQIGLDLPAQSSTPNSPTPATAEAEPLSLFRFDNRRDRDRWLSALQIEFDQPLKALLKRPGTSVCNSAATSPTTSKPPTPIPTPSREQVSPRHDLLQVKTRARSPPSLSPSPLPSPLPSPSSTSPQSASATSPASAPSPAPISTNSTPTHIAPSPITPSSASPVTARFRPATPVRPLSPAELAAQAKDAVNTAAAAYTYYSQLLMLAASPEVVRLSSADEIVVPRDGTCGNVSLNQFMRAVPPLPQTANPKLRSAKAKEADEAAAAAALSAPAAIPFVPMPAPTPSFPSFNPSTHLKVSPLGLLRRVQDQHLYFPFLSYFRSNYSALLFRTRLPSVALFQENTPSTSIFKMGQRGLNLQEIDAAMTAYHAFMAVSTSLIRTSKLVCFETAASSASTSSSQIGFAFPGFDSQVFDIGRFSVISPAQMFLGLDNSFEDGEWHTAMKASSVGKELMQSSADFTALFESSNAQDQNRARSLMHSAQLEVLHNIALAAHMRYVWSEHRERLREGDIISYSDVLSQFEAQYDDSDLPSPLSPPSRAASPVSVSDMDLFQYSRNRMQLEQWSDVVYVYSPPRSVLLQFLRARMEAFMREHPEVAGVVACEEAQSILSRTSPSPSVVDDVVDMSPNPMLPVPVHVTSYESSRHFLFDAFHFLLFLRLLFDERKKLLERLENALHIWLGKYQKDSSKSKSTAKYENILLLQTQAEEEKKKIVAAMNQLPSSDVIEGVLRLSRSVPLAAPAIQLTSEQRLARQREQLAGKSRLSMHLQTRTNNAPVAAADTPPTNTNEQ